MAKTLVVFLSFAKFVIRGDKGIASFGPLNVLAGMGVLGLSFCFVGFHSGLQSERIPYSVWSREATQIDGRGCSGFELYTYNGIRTGIIITYTSPTR